MPPEYSRGAPPPGTNLHFAARTRSWTSWIGLRGHDHGAPRAAHPTGALQTILSSHPGRAHPAGAHGDEGHVHGRACGTLEVSSAVCRAFLSRGCCRHWFVGVRWSCLTQNKPTTRFCRPPMNSFTEIHAVEEAAAYGQGQGAFATNHGSSCRRRRQRGAGRWDCAAAGAS